MSGRQTFGHHVISSVPSFWQYLNVAISHWGKRVQDSLCLALDLEICSAMLQQGRA